MKRVLGVMVLVLVLTSLFSAELVIYTSDSFAGGIARVAIPKFEKTYNCKVKVLSLGSMGDVLARLIVEKRAPKADVVVGLSSEQLQKAISEGILEKYRPVNSKNIVYKDLINDYGTVYDYGALAMIYNIEKIKNPPKSFKDLLNPEYKGKIVLVDPRTSSTGLTFLMWTVAAMGEDGAIDYWKKLKNNVLTFTSGWSAAFKMLETGEADIIASYATDAAYSMYEYGSIKYMPVIFEEGAYVLEEYAAIVKGAKNKALARAFIEYILTPEFQREIPLNQWMMPVTNVELPEVFRQYVPSYKKILKVDPNITTRLDEILKKWEKAVIG
ncbi:MAG TPA: thiamine ABC transporter substrate-binding protein [Fervidobacterium sp.]|mgnify:FL=1|nr:thiamine ABC transporter substrate-binding protein [Fervidobacterium sp.]HPZ18127.1 thiamine ABC transporter substrate-binding protein [Fervidobacterium sp.]HQE48223.1 thiamine ABC transporter substrate-binding protein [Fervidobacterium sp.]HRD20483.1 thiamine ABC transporter substrate-binding protein [Fervidobacterium sp.]HUM42102.1 thiamine ABC transporter substrate-binding protein [Fervidobacterium sp.]